MYDRKRQNILTDISDLGQAIEDFKASQPIGGASFKNYYTEGSANGGLFDLSYTQNTFKRAYRVTFTHDVPPGDPNAKLHILHLAAFFRLNNGNVMAAPYVTNVGRVAQMDVVPEVPINGQNTWLVTTENFDWPFPGTPYDFYWKLFFKGTTGGTFSVTHLWAG